MWVSTVARNGTRVDIERIKEEIEDYLSTVKTLQAFVGLATWLGTAKDGSRIPNSQYSLGRRMDTSDSNVIAPNITVTPDAVIQRSENLGLVAEAKKTLPPSQEDWDDVVNQLRKYDDDLIGWWTPNERIPESNVILLIDSTLSRRLARFVDQRVLKEPGLFRGKVCIVEFGRTLDIKEFLLLRSEWGDVGNSELAERLRDGVPVPMDALVASYGTLKFYDSPPPTEHLMEVLWLHIFNPMKSEAEFDEALRCWPLHINVEDLTRQVQDLFGSPGRQPREPEYPRHDWVRKALEAFVRVGLAKPKENAEYVVLFRELRGDAFEKFARQRTKRAKEGGPDVVQPRLFDD